MKNKILLFDLPTFPKGVISLSLPKVATLLGERFDVEIIDLNLLDYKEFMIKTDFSGINYFGLKVSAQNYNYAKEVSALLKSRFNGICVFWGGELPTLLPEECKKYADTIVRGQFDTIAQEFITDVEASHLKPEYVGITKPTLQKTVIDFKSIKDISRYYSFMGLPLETTSGCTEHCTFCMVHTMQSGKYSVRDFELIAKQMPSYTGHFVNIVDYNFGVDKGHVMGVAGLLKNSGANGWMAEMCIELLDDDELLTALRDSGCRVIYCGLETIDDYALRSIHKMNTNHIAEYSRIIKKAQGYGIQIGAGVILGIEGMTFEKLRNIFNFFTDHGIMYAKLTFLTYNPGTKVNRHMRKKGEFITDDIARYDGNHLTYRPHGLDISEVYRGAEFFIKQFYSLRGIVSRSFNTKLGFWRRIEFVCFNLCYREVYLAWLNHDIFFRPEGFRTLIEAPFRKGLKIKVLERIIGFCRGINS